MLAWICARYFCVLIGWQDRITGGACMTIACLFLCLDYVLNALSPRLAGKFQVSTTVIKMVPLALMAVVGTVIGLANGRMAENFATMTTATISTGEGLMASTVAVAFAYEGWILATSINAELKDAKRNLPRALILGSFIVVATYILYYIGLNGTVTTEELMASGEAAAKMAFQRLLGPVGGVVVFALIVVSCAGTLNGLMLSCCRGMYALAVRGEGPRPDLFRQVDPVTNMPTNSAIVSLGLDAFWLLFFYGANLDSGWFGPFCFDSSELPIITLYGMYVPMFIQLMRKATDLGTFRRFVMPGPGSVRLRLHGVRRLCRLWYDRVLLSHYLRRGHGDRQFLLPPEPCGGLRKSFEKNWRDCRLTIGTKWGIVPQETKGSSWHRNVYPTASVRVRTPLLDGNGETFASMRWH